MNPALLTKTGALGTTGGGGLAGLMDMLGPAALAFLPALLGGMFNRSDPQAKAYHQYLLAMSPQALQAAASQHLAQLMQGPAYSAQLQAITAGQQGAQSAINSGLARSGANMSGIGALSAGAPNLGAAQARVGLVGNMQQQSDQWALDRARSFSSGFPQMSPGPNHYASLFAGGLNAFGPLLSSRMGWAGQPKSMRTTLYG